MSRTRQSLRLVLELGREAVRTRPFEVPSTFVADPSGFGDAHRLRNNAQQRVADDGRGLAVHTLKLLTIHLKDLAHLHISYAVFCLKKKIINLINTSNIYSTS